MYIYIFLVGLVVKKNHLVYKLFPDKY